MNAAAPVFVPRPDPLTVLVPVWSAFLGVAGAVVTFLAPMGVSSAIPALGVYIFCAGSLGSALAVLLSMLGARLGKPRAVEIQRGAWVALGSLDLVYAGWLTQAFGLRAYVLTSLLMTICVASFWQARRLNAVLSRMED